MAVRRTTITIGALTFCVLGAATACNAIIGITDLPADGGSLEDAANDSLAADGMIEVDSGSDSAPLDSSADGYCPKPPRLYTPIPNVFHCYFGTDGGGGLLYCPIQPQSVCCLASSVDAGFSVCGNAGKCPLGDQQYACAAPEDCSGGGQVCCLTAGPLEADPNCAGYQKTKGFDNTRCTTAQACSGMIDAGNQYVVCEQQANCTAGTCTAIKTVSTSIGVCL